MTTDKAAEQPGDGATPRCDMLIRDQDTAHQDHAYRWHAALDLARSLERELTAKRLHLSAQAEICAEHEKNLASAKTIISGLSDCLRKEGDEVLRLRAELARQGADAESAELRARIADGKEYAEGVEDQLRKANEAITTLRSLAPSATVTDAMVDRFLAWPLPDSVCADLNATQQGARHRSGTTLLTAIEARQMLNHVLAAAPAASQPETSGCDPLASPL